MEKNKHRKGFDYFQFFIKIADAANEAADYLDNTINHFDVDKLPAQVETMHKIENDADLMKHEMLTRLGYEFITPIEREDIVQLAQQLDNVVDAIDDVMQRLYMFHIDEIHPDALPFCKQIIKATRGLAKVMHDFRNFKKSKEINQYCIEVNTAESEGDKMFASYMRKLYAEPNGDLMHVIVWTTMFEGMENCLDACEDAVDIVESVIMKNM